VFDLLSQFDATCQEVGHALGLKHELDRQGVAEYGCPYSVMSAMSDMSFERPFDNRLPGVLGPANPARIAGPYIPAAHLYINQNRPVNPRGAFNDASTVTYVSAAYEHTPQRIRLVARDAALAAWPSRRPVLAVLPPVVPGGDTYFLELRRADSEYDQAITTATVVLLAGNFFSGSGPVADPAEVRLNTWAASSWTAPRAI
jgi:hypothetical protein